MNNILSGMSIKREAEEISVSNNIIGKGTVITGNIETTANLRIEGKVVGDVRTKAKVAIGESALIQGNVFAQNAEVDGQIEGKIEITDLLLLKATCIIHGDIISNKLAIETGAKFNGECKMGGAVTKDIIINGKPRVKEEATV